MLHKVPPTFLLPSLEVIPPSSPVQTTLVASESTLKVGSVLGVKKIVISDEVIMKTLEHLEDENSEVKDGLKKQDEKTSKIKRMLGMILSRLSPLLRP